MLYDYKFDNIIALPFEKCFNQLFPKSSIYQISYKTIKEKTFENKTIHQIISDLTGKSPLEVGNFLSQINYQRDYLISKLEKLSHVYIVLNQYEELKSLKLENVDFETLNLSIVNYREDIFTYLFDLYKSTHKLIPNELLLSCAELANENLYFKLRETCEKLNSSIYNKAVQGGSLKIVNDCNIDIDASDYLFEMHLNATTLKLSNYLSSSMNTKSRMSYGHMHYLNSNQEIIKLIPKDIYKNMKVSRKLYYSALLSSDIQIVKLIESNLPEIHKDRILDAASTENSGKKSILLDETCYTINHISYFAHTMNYAIQSDNLEIVKYIYDLGYGISQSNLITCIRQGNLLLQVF